MLEVLNKRKRKIDMKNLGHVNPFWKKDLVKNQKRLFKWLARFSYNDVIDAAKTFTLKEYIDYNDYLAFVNNANNLLFVKSKKMTDSLKVVNKLKKMIADFGAANAIYSLIITIDEFYDYDNTAENSYDKRKEWIKIYNENLDEVWQRYQLAFLDPFKDEKVLKQKAQDAFDFDKQKDDELFFPKATMEVLFGFMRKAWSHKKVSDKQFNDVYLFTLFTYYYMYAYHKLTERILMSFPTKKSEKKHHLFHFGKKKNEQEKK